jgi:hypothetical protein
MSKVEVRRAGDLKVVVAESSKPGVRSSEFWAVSCASVLVMLLSVLNRVFGWDINFSEAEAATLIAGLVAVYASGRSFVKAIAEGTTGKVAAAAAVEPQAAAHEPPPAA